MPSLEVAFPLPGDVLSRHDGREAAEGLHITVRGRCPEGAVVRVNGVPTPVAGAQFEAPILLTKPRNTVEVAAGGEAQSLVVLYDRLSTPRYRFSVDDVIWTLTEIARHPQRYPSLFDHWFLAFFRTLHRQFGTHVQFNIYYEDPDASFDLRQFPDRYRGEWQDNADWLRLAFHARSNDCYGGRIYRDAGFETVKTDHDLVVGEICRFAGEGTLLDTYTTLHWAECTLDAARALRACGIRGLTGRFGLRPDGRPHTTRYYLDEARNRHFHTRNMWFDAATDLYFVNVPEFLNNIPLAKVVPHCDALLHGTYGGAPYDVIDFLVHEEQFWFGFQNGRGYKADNQERCLVAAQWAAERGLKPVNFEHGLAGNGTLV